ncbi:MAG: Holliday junction resolvase RuvX [Microscillaceae bacterium]|nr:Holliday junction resolvase RuvX [Microscillaceae bacterium]MDW8461383.1 Holliday junction resolvase RuvX [Cytophagales bacterium]
MRILAIDFGEKRCGLAVTDKLQIIATPLEAIPTANLLAYLENYAQKESLSAIVIGKPLHLDNTQTDIIPTIQRFIQRIKAKFPHIPIYWVDERFTSKMAVQAMIQAGSKKKQRQKKENLDKISASLILQTFLEQKNNGASLELA